MITILKITVSAMIILAVNILAKKFPGIGGLIAALPIVSLLSATWLVIEKTSARDVAHFLTGVLSGLLPTAILLAITIILLYRGWPFSRALGLAVTIWFVSSCILQALCSCCMRLDCEHGVTYS